MPHNRFYTPHSLATERLSLEGPEYHHMVHVMRLCPGETIELINGRGELAQATIFSLHKKEAQLHILKYQKHSPSPSQISLGIPLLRPSKLEWIIEKGTELGVDSFLFYPADLGEKQTLSPKHLERLRLLTIAAIKQSGRLFLPHLEILSLSTLLTRSPSLYYGDPNGSPLQSPTFPLLFITGPESGFSEAESLQLQQTAQGVRLSPFTLRTETAPLAAASIFAWQQLL